LLTTLCLTTATFIFPACAQINSQAHDWVPPNVRLLVAPP
jgi:hypothetical protein